MEAKLISGEGGFFTLTIDGFGVVLINSKEKTMTASLTWISRVGLDLVVKDSFCGKVLLKTTKEEV